MNSKILGAILIVGLLILGVGIYSVVFKSEAPTLPVIETKQPDPKPEPTKQELSKTIEVPMNTPWTDTGIRLGAGQSINITANGRGVWKNIAKDNPNATPNSYEECGPDGTAPNAPDYHSNISYYQFPKANKGALIGKIGENGIVFLVGSKLNERVENDGILFLGINDQKPEYGSTNWADNSGNFNAQITVRR